MPYLRIERHELLVEAFGYWPIFHDAEIRSLLLDRNAVLFGDIADACLDVCIHAFEWTRHAQPIFNHHLVQIRFHDVNDLTLAGFNHQNAILELRIEECERQTGVQSDLKITFVPAFGLAGTFLAARAEVLSVMPCNEMGNPF